MFTYFMFLFPKFLFPVAELNVDDVFLVRSGVVVISVLEVGGVGHQM